MLIVAVRTPMALGLKVTVKVVVPPPLLTLVAASVVSMKSAAFVPPIVTRGEVIRARIVSPELVIVNVLAFVPPETATEPKSVSSVSDGELAPSAIELPSPETSISGG